MGQIEMKPTCIQHFRLLGAVRFLSSWGSLGATSMVLLLAFGVAAQVPAAVEESSLRNFDLSSKALDPNGFLLNPYWYYQLSNPGKTPDPSSLCNGGLPNSSDCTSQQTSENLPIFPKVMICMWELTSPLIGHINWTPATYTGGIIWRERTPDQDLNWATRPENNNGLTQGSMTSERGYLGLEFDSRETVRNLHTQPWQDIWNLIQKSSAADKINEILRQKTVDHELPYAVMTGLMGVDCEHDCHTELHPVYVLALQLDPSARDNVWAVVVRNWGNEGFCAHGQQELSTNQNQVQLFLPHKGTVLPQVTALTQLWSNVALLTPTVAFVQDRANPGILLTFKLPPATRRPLAELELHLNWPDGAVGPSGGKAEDVAVESAPQHGTVENYLEGLESNPEMSRQSIESLQEGFAERKRNLNTAKIMQGPLPVQSVNRIPVLESTPTTRAVKSVFDPVEQQEDEALFDQLCTVYKGQPLSHFPGACSMWSRIEKSRSQATGH
ncbi:MAG TPA: hypothetical protein VJP02_05670 [Candidatus Sulfotelmatobacter sp.]|nr:hypothetical protein [Candidatus Sulfotelmatobacter sp.]